MDILNTVGPFLVFVFIGLIFIIKSAIQVQSNQRGVTLRFGRIYRYLESGLNLTVPFIDRVIYVDVTKHIPSWQELSDEELKKQVLSLVERNPINDYR